MIILASKSPRRKQLLIESGLEFIVKHFEVDEAYPKNLVKHEIPLFLSRKKAELYPDPLYDVVLICADTIVSIEDKVLNKPKDFADAYQMLKTLSGKMHEVYTGITLRREDNYQSFYEKTEVYFKPLSNEEIEQYIKHFRPYDKAGAYGIQEWIGYIGVEKIVGCYYNVMGMPVSRLYNELLTFHPKATKSVIFR